MLAAARTLLLFATDVWIYFALFRYLFRLVVVSAKTSRHVAFFHCLAWFDFRARLGVLQHFCCCIYLPANVAVLTAIVLRCFCLLSNVWHQEICWFLNVIRFPCKQIVFTVMNYEIIFVFFLSLLTKRASSICSWCSSVRCTRVSHKFKNKVFQA